MGCSFSLNWPPGPIRSSSRDVCPYTARYPVNRVEVCLVYTNSGEGEIRKSGESELANFVFTGEGFSLNLGFRKKLCSQEMDSVLFQVS